MAAVNPIRIRLRYADLETFVEKFAPNVTRGGVFLASRQVQPVGTVVRFEIQLMAGEIVLAGEGRVTWVKEHDPLEPNRPYGMGVQFIGVAPASKPVLARILRAKDKDKGNVKIGQSRRPTTGDWAPLEGTSQGIAHGPAGDAGAASRHASGLSSGTNMGPYAPALAGASTNGRRAVAPPVDTSVDLAAEYGVDEHTVRRLIERTWMTGIRSTDDLADLLRQDPPEAATLAQALADLPRLLDPQYSRRRRSSTMRYLHGPNAATEITGSLAGPIDPADDASQDPPGMSVGGLPKTGSSAADAADAAPTENAAAEIADLTGGGEEQTVQSLPEVSSVPGLNHAANGRNDR